MPTPSIQTLTTDAQQVLNLDSISAVRSVVAVALANANTGTPLNPNLTTQQLWDQFYQVVTRPKSDIESIIANQLMKFLYSPPAPGGAGADKQVIFNDGGVLAGDADFLWNKTTNLLTVTGSATISGDLTVDTSTLKVDSTNNRVGIQITSPTAPLEVGETSGTALRLRRLTSGNTIDVNFYNTNTTVGDVAGIRCDGDGLANTFGAISFWTTQTPNSLVERYRISSVGVHTWQNVGGVAGTAMTLNSTGLIRGASSADIISIESTTLTNIGNIGAAYGTNTGTYFAIKVGAANGTVDLKADARSGSYPPITFITGAAERMRIDSSGNVGIGVTPSAWGLGSSGYRAFEIGAIGNSIFSATNDLNISSNAYYLAGWKYGASSYASQYSQGSGKHIWYTASSGTAGNAITFTQAMTLDASGNLLVGTTAMPSGVVAARLVAKSTSADWTGVIWNSNATPYGVRIQHDTDSNNTGNEFLNCLGAANLRASIRSNGGIANYQANDVSLSDSRLKTDINPLGSYWNKIKSLELVTFKYKDQTHSDDNIGLIAQQVESVAPELVDVDGFGETPSDGVPIKTIYTTDLYHAAIKALQEAMARIEALEAKLA